MGPNLVRIFNIGVDIHPRKNPMLWCLLEIMCMLVICSYRGAQVLGKFHILSTQAPLYNIVTFANFEVGLDIKPENVPAFIAGHHLP